MKDTYIKGVAAAATGGSVGAKLMKTNQQTSFRTGDDGDMQQGRLNSFFTLNSNNVFGTNERFTDELGTQAYSNRIAIDHSTDNGTEILGFFADGTGTNRTWEDSIDWALSVSVGTFTSGWSLPNKRQMYSVIDDGAAGHGLNYSTFLIIGNALSTGYWSSTTTNNNTTYGVMISSSRYSAERVIKTLAVRAYAVRNFTYSDLGVTGAINPIPGAKIMKTGQTVSYATGDDGDLQEGRDVDFLTLNSNNPFGNVNRFTKTDGTAGSVGTVQWIIDWSTFDGTEVFGFVNYWWSLGNFNWSGMLTFCNAYSLGGYSGCRSVNAHEIISLTSFEVGIGYLPILTTNTSLGTWTNNTLKISTSFAYYTTFNDGRLQYSAKTSTYNAMPVRTFTVTGTTLT